MTKEEEKDKFQALYLAKGKKAKLAIRNEIVVRNLRLVISWAEKFANRGVPFEDLIGEGCTGLITAVGKFDVERGFKFSTYASWWIKQAMQAAIQNNSRIVRIPPHLVSIVNKILTMANKKHCKPDDLKVAKDLNLTIENIQTLLNLTGKQTISIDHPTAEDGMPLHELLSNGLVPQDDMMMKKEGKARLIKVLKHLEPREEMIVRMRFGIVDD